MVLQMRVLIAAVAVAAITQTSPVLQDFTVAAGQLPADCVLSPSPSIRPTGNTIRAGLWANLPANPWIGTDPVIIASMRESLEPPPSLPDGPPLNPHDAAIFRLHLAAGIDEGYEAVYLSHDSSTMVIVYAFRFATPSSAQSFWENSGLSRNPNAAAGGPIVAVATGPAGECRERIAAHLKSIVR
jgi:hypothetical protein